MRVVIIGAGYAGLTCALALSRKAPADTHITLVNAGSMFVERIRLHEQAAGRAAPSFDLHAFLSGTRVQLEVGEVEHIDLEARRVRVAGASIAWDELVLALGSRTAADAVPGAREHAFTLDAGSAPWLAQAVPSIAKRGGHVAVVGGGLTGIEAAAELAEAYPSLRVSLLTRGAFAAELAPKSRVHLTAAMTRLGVRVREHVRVARVEPRVLHTDEGAIPFDACVWTAGFEAPPLAQAAGFACAPSGQLYADARLHAEGHEHVWVAGDLLTLRAPCGDPLTQGCKSAFPTGLHVTANIVRSLRGEAERPYAHQSVFFCVSLGRRDGLLQSPSADLRLARRVLTGRTAARAKELICRGTRWMLTALRLGARIGARLPARRPRALAATSTASS